MAFDDRRYYNPETFSYQNKPYEETSGRAAGNAPNSAQNSIGAAGIGAAAEIGSTAIGAGFQASELNSAQNEARQLAEQTRSDQLKQQNINFSLKKQIQEQDKKRFELNKLQENETLRHNTWLSEFQKALDNQQFLMESTEKIFKDPDKSEQIKNIILNNFRRKK